MNDATLLTAFLEGTIDPASFSHETHVRVTFLLLRERPLPETLIALRDGLTQIATKAGHPEKYHETITFAFAAIINERMQRGLAADWSAFAQSNADLLSWRSGGLLLERYDPATLHTDEARRMFVLPR
jgi:hypothetical protein